MFNVTHIHPKEGRKELKVDQQLFNIVIAVAGFLGGFWMKTMWDSLKELRVADADLTTKVHGIETLVVGDYVRWDSMRDVLAPLSAQLLRIENKLDGKMDKAHTQ